MIMTEESSVGSTTESRALPTWSAGIDSRSADRAKSIAEVVVPTCLLSLISGISLKFRCNLPSYRDIRTQFVSELDATGHD